MRVRLGSALLPINALTWILILVIVLFPSNMLRIVLGIPFLLFFPGYTLMSALFTRREGMGGIERVALSFGLSIAVVPLIGLILNYTPWGIRLDPILYSVAVFILITSVIAWLRRRGLAEEERFNVEFQIRPPGWGERGWDRALTIILVLTIVGALGTLGYVVAAPKVGETFTEFYILGQEGKASDYPKELKVGQEATVTVGIINHEAQETVYRVEVLVAGEKAAELGPLTLADEQKWEGETAFVSNATGQDQKVDFLLYKGDEAEPSLELHLWVNVTE